MSHKLLYIYAGSISSCLPFAYITNGSGVSTRPFTTKPTQIRRGNAVANCRKKQVKEREIKWKEWERERGGGVECKIYSTLGLALKLSADKCICLD